MTKITKTIIYKLIFEGILLLVLAVDHRMCSFIRHRYGSNCTSKTKTVTDITDGGGKSVWIVDTLMYSFFGFVGLVIMYHCYVKQQRRKQLKKVRQGNRYRFEWELLEETESFV